MNIIVTKNGKTLSVQAVINRLTDTRNVQAGRIGAILAAENLTLEQWLSTIANKVGSDFVLKNISFHSLDRDQVGNNGESIWGYRNLKYSPRWAMGKVWEQKNTWDGHTYPRIHECENPTEWVHDGTESYPSNSVSYYSRTADIRNGYFIAWEDAETILIVLT